MIHFFHPSAGRWGNLLFFPFYFAVFYAQADIYKWTDEDGKVHYGDRPGDTPSEKIEIKNSPAPDEGFQLRREKRQRLLELYEEERDEKQQKTAEEETRKSEIRRKCRELMDYQRILKEAGRLYELDNEGNRRYLDTEEQQKEIAEVDNFIEDHCT